MAYPAEGIQNEDKKSKSVPYWPTAFTYRKTHTIILPATESSEHPWYRQRKQQIVNKKLHISFRGITAIVRSVLRAMIQNRMIQAVDDLMLLSYR